MSKISVFNFVSIDGFFAGPNGEIDWFYAVEKDDEWENYTHNQTTGGNALIFGHNTYRMMKSYWPTLDAIRNDPTMANVVNNSLKIVFSKTLKNVEEEPNWKNIKLLNEINRDQIRKLEEDRDFTILGSGSIIRQFSNLDLIDEYELAVVPVVLGSGKSFFSDVKKINLHLVQSKSFNNGIVLLNYQVKKEGIDSPANIYDHDLNEKA